MFLSYTPNWFEFTSLIVTIGTIWGAFKVSEHVYEKEKVDKRVENISLQFSENELFKNNLGALIKPIKSQIKSIKRYLIKDDLKLKFYPEIQVDFLQFISIKEIYKKNDLHNKKNIEAINNLMTNLYTLYDFRTSLRDEVRTYIEKYNYHERKFYLYRSLLNGKFFELSNLRAIGYTIDKGIKKWGFDPKDNFMLEYSKLRMATFDDKEIIDNDGLKDRKLLNEKFIVPLAEIANNYIPEDHNAIEVNDISCEVNAAFQDMEEITKKHKNSMEGYKKSLEIVLDKIEQFLSTQ